MVIPAIMMGLGATLLIDLWALFLRRAFDVRSLDFCLLGRWVLHMPGGTLVHESIGKAAPKSHECAAGWLTHYTIGVAFAVAFVLLAPDRWLASPTLLPAMTFGVVTVLVPFFTLQPALGLGVASSKAPRPTQARLRSIVTHAVFGTGLYLVAMLLAASRR